MNLHWGTNQMGQKVQKSEAFWCRENKVSKSFLKRRLKAGMTVDDAIQSPRLLKGHKKLGKTKVKVNHSIYKLGVHGLVFKEHCGEWIRSRNYTSDYIRGLL